MVMVRNWVLVWVREPAEKLVVSGEGDVTDVPVMWVRDCE